MSKVSGHGGYWVVSANDRPAAVVHNAEYEADVEGMIDDTTDSGSIGAAEGTVVGVTKVNALTMSVAEDDVAYPQALGLTENSVLTVWLKRGSLNQWDRVDGTIVRSVRVTNPQTAARRVTVTCEYGRLTRNASGPG